MIYGIPTGRSRVPERMTSTLKSMIRRGIPGRRALASAIAAVVLTAGPTAFARPAAPSERKIQIFDRQEMRWDKDQPEVVDAPDPSHPDAGDPQSFVVRFRGQSVQRSVDLPKKPASHRDVRRVTIRVEVEPITTKGEQGERPNDPWPRLGRVAVVLPDRDGMEVELIRFVTGFGGPVKFQQDVTALAPLLEGRCTIVASLSTFSEAPSWRLSVSLGYSKHGLGPRWPTLAEPLFEAPHVTAEDSRLQARVTIPAGVEQPRIWLTSTGHATDGAAENEFVSCTHILRVDGQEIARWRPWSERGGRLRRLNPLAGRQDVDGREIWSSDLDRSGWHPGLAVRPLIVPAPELTPGEHLVELVIKDIRPRQPGDTSDAHGYWVVSGLVVADGSWILPAPTPGE